MKAPSSTLGAAGLPPLFMVFFSRQEEQKIGRARDEDLDVFICVPCSRSLFSYLGFVSKLILGTRGEVKPCFGSIHGNSVRILKKSRLISRFTQISHKDVGAKFMLPFFICFTVQYFRTCFKTWRRSEITAQYVT